MNPGLSVHGWLHQHSVKDHLCLINNRLFITDNNEQYEEELEPKPALRRCWPRRRMQSREKKWHTRSHHARKFNNILKNNISTCLYSDEDCKIETLFLKNIIKLYGVVAASVPLLFSTLQYWIVYRTVILYCSSPKLPPSVNTSITRQQQQKVKFIESHLLPLHLYEKSWIKVAEAHLCFLHLLCIIN